MSKKIRVFVDTSIPIYAAGKNHPTKEHSVKLLKEISLGKIIGLTSTEVLQEILNRYKSVNLLNYGIKIFDEFSKIVDDILPINFHIVKEAREILSKHSEINTRYAIQVATMNYYEVSYIATFDKRFCEFENIKYYKFGSC